MVSLVTSTRIAALADFETRLTRGPNGKKRIEQRMAPWKGAVEKQLAASNKQRSSGSGRSISRKTELVLISLYVETTLDRLAASSRLHAIRLAEAQQARAEQRTRGGKNIGNRGPPSGP